MAKKLIISSVYLPSSKMVYRVGGNVVNSNAKIAKIEMANEWNPIQFVCYDDQDHSIALITTSEATVTYLPNN